MRSVNVNKQELLQKLQENLSKHAADYEVALEEYFQVMFKCYNHNLKLLETKDEKRLLEMKLFPTKPVNYVESYENVIRMLNMSVDNIVELNEDEFKNYILDEWNWKPVFNAITSSYKNYMK